MNAFDRHKQLVNNYLTYYGKGARNLFKPDTSKWKKDIDLARENHRFLWEVKIQIHFRYYLYIIHFNMSCDSYYHRMKREKK